LMAAQAGGRYGRRLSDRRGYGRLHRSRAPTCDRGAFGAAVLADGGVTRALWERRVNAQSSRQTGLAQVVTKAICFKDFTLHTSGREHGFHRKLGVKSSNFCYLRPRVIVVADLHIVNG
jgi:hypothetical protein